MRRGAAALVILCCTIVVVAGPASSTAVVDCASAERLAAFDLDAARAEYLKLLKLKAPPACAATGLAALGERHRAVLDLLAQAEDLIALDRDAEAVALIARVLVLDPAAAEAQRLLDELASIEPPPPNPKVFAGATALMNARYQAEAREEARKVALAEKTEIPPRLQAPQRWSMDWVKNRTADVGTVAAAIAIPFAVLVVLVGLLQKAALGAVRRRKVALGAFTIHPTPAKESSKEPPAPTDGELKAVVAEELALASRSSRTFKTVDGAGVDLPKVIDVPEQLKPLTTIMQVLFRRTVLSVVAAARQRPGGDWQVTGSVTHGRRVVQQETFVVPMAAGSDVQSVGVWLASWALYVIYESTGRRRRKVHPLGTSKWRSFAWVRSAESPGLSPSARRDRLNAALSEDHANPAALARLGADQTENVEDARVFDEGLNHLTLALGALTARPTRPTRRFRGRPHLTNVRFEPLWFQAQYLLATRTLHRAFSLLTTSGAADAQRDLQNGTHLARELTKAIAATWLTVLGPWRRRAVSTDGRAELKRMLDNDDEYQLGVLVGALVAGPCGAAVDKGKPTTRRAGRALWEWLAKIADSSKDEDIGELFRFVTNPAAHSNASTLYNISCVLALSGHPEAAFERLRARFDHATDAALRDAIDWAGKDPSLHALRNDPVYGLRYAELVRTLEKRIPPAPPAALSASAAVDRWVVEVLSGG